MAMDVPIELVERMGWLRLYSIDFNTAGHTLRYMRRYRRKDVRYCLLRDFAVTYYRPFSGNHGPDKRAKKDRLGLDIVPAKFQPLHHELKVLRNERFAHTDMGHYNPRFSQWKHTTGIEFPMSFKGFDYDTLDRRTSELEGLVNAVDAELDKRICAVETQIEALMSVK